MNVTLGLENIPFIVVFFLNAGWLNRFGSVQSVLDFRNRTEPEFFYDFFFGSVFSVIFFPVFSV